LARLVTQIAPGALKPADVACRRQVIVDAHNDVLLELEPESLTLELRRGPERLLDRYWMPQLEAAGVGIQICPLYGACEPGEGARERALAQAAELGAAVEANPERMCRAGTRAELDDPRLRLILSMEGVEPLEGDPGAFEAWWELGVRSVGLTWNHPNEFAGGVAAPEQGLSARGRALVRRFAELGVVLDLAHASERTWRDVIAEEVPFSVTHACCRALCDHPRNLADWQLEALAERGGVLGLMGIAFAVGPGTPELARLLDHFDHAVAVMGVEHVGIGADFIETTAAAKARNWARGFTAPEDYPALTAALRARGYDGQRLEAIESGNWLRVLRASLPA
jgi:membrane dipeptidase